MQSIFYSDIEYFTGKNAYNRVSVQKKSTQGHKLKQSMKTSNDKMKKWVC